MLESFFDIRKNSRKLFEGLEIARQSELCSKWMNQYPTVSVSFRQVDGLNFTSAYDMLTMVFADLYNLAPAGDYEATYDFGDITYNEEEDRARNLTLANAGYIPKWQYLVRFEGYSEEEARAAVEEASGKEENGLFKEE